MDRRANSRNGRRLRKRKSNSSGRRVTIMPNINISSRLNRPEAMITMARTMLPVLQMVPRTEHTMPVMPITMPMVYIKIVRAVAVVCTLRSFKYAY